RRSAPPPASASALRRRNSASGSLVIGLFVIVGDHYAASWRAVFETFAQAQSSMPLNFGGIAGTHFAGIFVERWRRKFGLPYSQNANRQMSREGDATEQKSGPDGEICNDRQNPQRDLFDGDSPDRALHQGDHAGQRQSGGAEHCRHGRKDSHAHAGTPAAFLTGNAATDAIRICIGIQTWGRQSPDRRYANRQSGDWRSQGGLMQTGPVVRHKDRIAGIGRIVLHAGRLAGSDALEAQALFETRYVLRGFVGNARYGITIADQPAQTVSSGF